MVEIVERRIASQGKGYIFVSRHGKPLTKKRIHTAFDKLRERKAVREFMAEHGIEKSHVIPYSLRHTFITRALLQGVSVKLLADLMGTSVRCIETNYGHATGDKDAMRKVFLGLNASPGTDNLGSSA